MNEVAEWLASEEGLEWSHRFSDEPTEYHGIIELVDDTADGMIADHASCSSDQHLEKLREEIPEWADLTWTPDCPP